MEYPSNLKSSTESAKVSLRPMFGRFDVVYQPKIGEIGKIGKIGKIFNFITNFTIPKLEKSRRPKNLGKTPGGPRSIGFYGSAPKHPFCMGYVKIRFFSKNKTIFFAKNPKIYQISTTIFAKTNSLG